MTRVPITSPLAVLTTRTTQEHLMATHSTTDLKPGDIVQHPEHGLGYVLGYGSSGHGRIRIIYADPNGAVGYRIDIVNHDGWERVETCTRSERQWLDYRDGVRCTCDHNPATTNGPEEDCEIHGRPYAEWVKRAAGAQAESARIETVRPGHVQVRVDDLDLGPDTGDSEEDFVAGWQRDFPECSEDDMRLIHRAIAAKRAESAPPADEPEIVGDGCECWVTPEHMWTTYGSAAEPGSQVEKNPRCPKHGEKPTNATVTLPCPDCGEAITRTAQVWTGSPRTLAWVTLEWHTCPPAQPDEPQEFGARIVVTDDLSGKAERWCRQHDEYWASENGALMTWAYLTQRGAVTLGWETLGWDE